MLLPPVLTKSVRLRWVNWPMTADPALLNWFCRFAQTLLRSLCLGILTLTLPFIMASGFSSQHFPPHSPKIYKVYLWGICYSKVLYMWGAPYSKVLYLWGVSYSHVLYLQITLPYWKVQKEMIIDLFGGRRSF